MATPDETSALARLLARATEPLPEAIWETPGDLSRMSIEALIAQGQEPRDAASAGRVRLSGAGVIEHRADLDAVGRVAIQWQRSVTSIGASLEGAKAAIGRLSDNVIERTRLSLNAQAAPGSVVLHVVPKASPLPEVAPGGAARLFDVPRPLADQASETLIGLLAQAAQEGPDADALAERIRELGPRVATAVKALADVLGREYFDLDAEWLEPEQPTRRVSISAGSSGWLRDFVAGRELDAFEEVVGGEVRTVSDVANWLLETDEGRLLQIDARSLDPDVVQATNVGQMLRLRVLVRTTQRPDGSSRQTFEALSVEEPDSTDSD